MPDTINVPYDRHTEARQWAQFAAHALAGHNAYGVVSDDRVCDNTDAEAVEWAAKQADMMLEEFKARFHHAPEAKPAG